MVEPEPDGARRGWRAVLTQAALEARDTPRTAYAVLERRATVATVGLLVALAAAAWWWTVDNARGMGDMTLGIAGVGSAMPYHMSALLFLSMWLTMMVAMMFPTIAPIVLLHRMVLRRRGESPVVSVAFAAGYLVAWTTAGLVPLLALLAFRDVTDGSAWVRWAGGGVLVAAGLYQFTRWKEACARACRTPLTFLATHDFGRGARGSFRTGVSHGLYCLGCCWALMAVLFVVGLMNLAWMAGIAVVFLAEKHWRRGAGLAKVVGVGLTVLGVAVLAHPDLLRTVSGQHSEQMMMAPVHSLGKG